MPKAPAPSFRADTTFPPTRPTSAPALLRRRPDRRAAARRFSCSPRARPTRSIAPSMLPRCRHGWRCGRSTAKPAGSMRSSAASRHRRFPPRCRRDHGAVDGTPDASEALIPGRDPRRLPPKAKAAIPRPPAAGAPNPGAATPVHPLPASQPSAASPAPQVPVRQLPARLSWASRRHRCRRRSKSGRRPAPAFRGRRNCGRRWC